MAKASIYAPQELFELVVSHMAEQYRSSHHPETGICMYFGPEGRRCPVGWVLRDEDYVEDMETYTLFELIEQKLLPEYLHEHMYLLCCLQQVHDDWGPNSWCDMFIMVARLFNFDPNFVVQVFDKYEKLRKQPKKAAKKKVPTGSRKSLDFSKGTPVNEFLAAKKKGKKKAN